MPPAADLSRRDFTKLTLAMAMTPTLASSTLPVNAPKRRAMGWSGYDDAIVIDAKSTGPGGRGEERLAIARASGVTAVIIRMGGGGPRVFEWTVGNISGLERDLTAHPDYFVGVRSVNDLRAAKESGRFGVIYGINAGPLNGFLYRWSCSTASAYGTFSSPTICAIGWATAASSRVTRA